MKKFLITLLLLFTITMNAQYEQILKEFEWVTLSQNDSILSTEKSPTRIFFNYRGEPKKAKIYIGDKYYDLYQLGSTIKDKNDQGIEYFWFEYRDRADEQIFLQYFPTENIIRIFLEDNLEIQLE